ncbi:MAG TPA: 4Fe-4S dicluster domain-containing protein [Anaerolineae bacterium]|jgi:anaerobic carbon-monoxide dehydrogenase iron sulfur subunit|nr:4Fe-4S dicluster domain-containing protein [Anaerolineae bacterium]
MKTVFVFPERCVGCKQCEIACAVAHSQSKSLFGAIAEQPRPQPRIHVAPGIYLSTAFANKCRHCDPAPCMGVCPTGAIARSGDTVLIDGDRCITCAMCAMVCPFDVIRYYEAAGVRRGKAVALKCDNCIDRQQQGQIPACVETCKTGALVFGDVNELARGASARLARVITAAVGDARAETVRPPANVQAWRDLSQATGQTGRE